MSNKDLKRVTGIGGFFFKCEDPNAVKEWYKKHLGLPTDQYGWTFWWKDKDGKDYALFSGDTLFLGDVGRRPGLPRPGQELLGQQIQRFCQTGVTGNQMTMPLLFRWQMGMNGTGNGLIFG